MPPWSSHTRPNRGESDYAPTVSASYIEFRGQGFWCRDGLLEVWLAMLVDEIDRTQRGDDALRMGTLRDCLYQHATIRFSGSKEAVLDPTLAGEGLCDRVLAVSRELRRRIARGEAEPAPGTLARRIGGALWAQDGWPSRLLRVADSFVWIIEVASRHGTGAPT